LGKVAKFLKKKKVFFDQKYFFSNKVNTNSGVKTATWGFSTMLAHQKVCYRKVKKGSKILNVLGVRHTLKERIFLYLFLRKLKVFTVLAK